MNNQQAINLLKGLEKNLDDYCELNDEGKTAFGMAITALELFGNSEQLPPAQPDTAKRIVGKSRDGMTLWYQCDTCNEPVDAQDNYCRGCGRRLIDE